MVRFWDQHGDPRVRDLPFMSSFRVPLFLLIAYLLFVFVLGPRWMRGRKPYNLRPLLLVYNSTLAVYNATVFAAFIADWPATWADILDTDFPPFPDVPRSAILFNYFYMISKFVDLLDTVFFVLRKRQQQITLLHFYHHTSVALFSWITIRLCAVCKPAVPFALINSFLHVLMYSYYGLSALGPSVRPYLWWKRYLTALQIAQFLPLLAHALYFISTQQGYSPFYTVNAVANPIVYIVLYSRFYRNRYSSSISKTIDAKGEKSALLADDSALVAKKVKTN